MFNYVLRPNVYNIAINPNPAPVDVQLFLGWTKNEPGVVPAAADIGVLYQFGSIATAPTGTSFDMLNPINTRVICPYMNFLPYTDFFAIYGLLPYMNG